MERICTGCAVLLEENTLSSFCSLECQYEFELSESYAAAAYREIDQLTRNMWND